MRLWKQGEHIFIKVGEDEMLCVGTQAEVDKASEQKKLCDLINMAWAIHKYNTTDWRYATRN